MGNLHYNAHSGNESPTPHYRTTDTVAGGYEGGTDDTRASKDCTIDKPDFIASYMYQGKQTYIAR